MIICLLSLSPSLPPSLPLSITVLNVMTNEMLLRYVCLCSLYIYADILKYKCTSMDFYCVTLSQGLKFKQFPYLLTLQLKRFDFDYQSMHRIKLNDR